MALVLLVVAVWFVVTTGVAALVLWAAQAGHRQEASRVDDGSLMHLSLS